MRVIITGGGRGGTTWLYEIVKAGNNNFVYLPGNEDHEMFQRKLPESYINKMAFENHQHIEGGYVQNINTYMGRYPDLKIIISIRHPIDHILSKMVRGSDHPIHGYGAADDGTLVGAISTVFFAFKMKDYLIEKYKDRVLIIKLEDMVSNIQNEVNKIAAFIEVEPNDIMLNAYHNIKNKHHIRTNNAEKIHQDRMNLFERPYQVYDEFFKDKSDIINIIYSNNDIKMLCDKNEYQWPGVHD